MIIAIPSKGRPGDVRSLQQIPSATLFVPENERAAYISAHVCPVVGVPNTVHGITQTRNWIMDWALTQEGGDRLVFIDDDLQAAGWVELLPFRSRRHTKMSEQFFLDEWEKLFEVTEQVGFRVWGTSTESAPRSVYPYKPFLFYSYVTASCMGIVNRDASLRFDEKFPVKEDYEICLRCIKEDGGIVAARYLFWENNHWTKDGGCKDYRTQAMEDDCIQRLIKKYPGMIRKVTRGGSEYSVHLSF